MSHTHVSSLTEIFRRARTKQADIRYWGSGASDYSPVTGTSQRTLYGEPVTGGEWARSLAAGLVPGMDFVAGSPQYGLGTMLGSSVLGGMAGRSLANAGVGSVLPQASQQIGLNRLGPFISGAANKIPTNTLSEAVRLRILADIADSSKGDVRVTPAARGGQHFTPPKTYPIADAPREIASLLQSGTPRVNADFEARQGVVGKGLGSSPNVTLPFTSGNPVTGGWRSLLTPWSRAQYNPTAFGRVAPIVGAGLGPALMAASNIASRENVQGQNGQEVPSAGVAQILGLRPDVPVGTAPVRSQPPKK